MRQVIKNRPVNTVAFQDVSPSKYYGLQYMNMGVGAEEGPRRAILTRKNFGGGNYYFLSVHAINQGNTAFSTYNSVQAAIQDALDRDGLLFEFESPKELLIWAAESK